MSTLVSYEGHNANTYNAPIERKGYSELDTPLILNST